MESNKRSYHFTRNLPWGACLLLILSLGWVTYYRDVYWVADSLWPRDNAKHHFPMFLYVVRYLKLLKQFPQWMYSDEGGIWIETLANNFLILMPHRLVGYAIAYFSNWEACRIYKLAVLGGQGVFLWGCYPVLRRLNFSKNICYLMLIAFFFSSVTLTFIHQEHALGTLFYIPFIWWGLCDLRRSAKPLFFISCLLGLSFNNHYPHLIVLYFGLVLLAGLAAYGETKATLQKMVFNLKSAGARLWVFSVLGFFISASPVFYSYFKFSGQLESPFRHQKGGIQTQSYEEYERINSAYSKADPRNFGLYLNFEGAERWNISLLDDNLFYAGPCIAFLLLLLLFTKVPFRNFHIFMCLGLALLSVGTFTTLPKYLMYLVPALKIFRQWYFFTAFLSLHLMVALFYCLRGIEQERGKTRGKWIVLGILMLAFCFKLPLIYALPGVFFCFTRAVFDERFKKLSVGFLYGWLILGSVFSSRFILETYRENLIPYKTTHLYRLNRLSPLLELRSIYWSFVARPNLLDEPSRLLTRQGPYRVDQSFLNLATPIHGGFEIPFPRSAKSFEWLQLNDGNWDLSFDKGTVDDSGLFPRLKIRSENSMEAKVLVRRKSGVWGVLILLMWLPLLLGLTFCFQRNWFAASLQLKGVEV